MPFGIVSLNRVRVSQQNLQRLGALLLVLVFVVISTACGSVAQASSSNSKALELSGAPPAGTVKQPYNAVLTVGGGVSPYFFTVISGQLPPGLSMNPVTGSFTGTPSTAGSYTFQVMVTDRPKSDFGSKIYSVQIGDSSGGGGSGGGGNGPIKVSISPASVTLVSAGTQQFTATVTGTSNTAVTWSASAGSVNSNGLYTAPTVQAMTNVSVTATSQASPTQSASAGVTVNPTQGQSLQITTSGLPQGQQGNSYAAAFAAAGGTTPYTWSVSSGSLPSGITMDASGNLSGTPSTTGVSTFTVMVTDAKNGTANGNFSVMVVSSSGYDGPAQLPLVAVSSDMSDTPANGNVIAVNAGSDLKSAFNNAQCGDTIQLQAGATFNGPIIIPARNCDASHWIIVRTSSPDSALPAEGQRVTPCYGGVSSLVGRPAYSCSNPTNVLAKVQMAQGGDGPFLLADGASHYRFVGLEITRPNGTKDSARLISTQGAADHIIVDRCWLHGQAQDETRNGFDTTGGTYIAVVDSYFNDFHCIASSGTCTDAHAISGGMGDLQDGPYLIRNNFLEASGEGVLFGGGHASKTPGDIEVIGNHFWKPWQWMQGNPGFVGGADGNPFIVKNHFELKNASRVLVEGNIMENSWGGFTQTGFAILLTPANQHTKRKGNVCPLCQVTDVTIRYNRISHAGGGMQLATEISPSKAEGAPALAGTRWSIHDIVMDDLNKQYVGGGGGFEIANGWPSNPVNTITINHITAFPDPDSHLMIIGNNVQNQSMYALVFTNNLVLTAAHPVWDAFGGKDSCAVKDVPITTITNCFTSNTFQNNGLIGSPKPFPPSSWPSGNFFPNSPADVGFANYNNGNGGDYTLVSTSPYKNKGSDGKDLGADIAGLNAALAGVE